MIHDKHKRPVYRLTGGTTLDGEPLAALHLWHGGEYAFQYVSTVDNIKHNYTDAVRHVERRKSKGKPRPPGVHYRPSGRSAWCYGVVLNKETVSNAVLTTDVSKVTCKACLKTIAERTKQ